MFVKKEYKALFDSLSSRQIDKLLSDDEIMQEWNAIVENQVNKHI
jgi:hypothetical protein